MGRPNNLPLSLSNLRISSADEEQRKQRNRMYRPKLRTRNNQKKTRDDQPRIVTYTHAQMISLWYSPAAQVSFSV